MTSNRLKWIDQAASTVQQTMLLTGPGPDRFLEIYLLSLQEAAKVVREAEDCPATTVVAESAGTLVKAGVVLIHGTSPHHVQSRVAFGMRRTIEQVQYGRLPSLKLGRGSQRLLVIALERIADQLRDIN